MRHVPRGEEKPAPDVEFGLFVSGVVCRQLGFPAGDKLCCDEAYGHIDVPYEEREGVVVLETTCTGTENSLLDCAQSMKIVNYYKCAHDQAAVACFTVAPAGRITLLTVP